MKRIEPHYDYSGTIHIHTTASDGGVDFADMVQAADNIDLDFIVLGDHNCIDSRHDSLASKALVVPGIELTPGYSATYDEGKDVMHYDSGPDHLLAIGITDVGEIHDNDPQANIDAVAARGGLSFLAHPGDYWLPWTDWDVKGFTGIEVWTYLSDWAEATMGASSISFAVRNPDAILRGPNEQIMRRWDIVGQKRRIVGIGSTDAHSKIQTVNEQQIFVFPPRRELSSLHTHVLLHEPLSGGRDERIEQVVRAIEEGRCYIALDARADATGFQFWLESHARRVEMGQEVMLDEVSTHVTIHVRASQAAQLTLKHNGNLLSRVIGSSLSLPMIAESGVYRVEVHLDNQPWVLSNPIYIRT